MWKFGCVVACCGVLLSGAASAQEVKNLFSNSVWEAYSYTEKKEKVCYAAARADRTQGGEKGRTGTALAVTHRGKAHNEVSLIGDYGFKDGSTATLKVGATKQSLMTKGKSAWAKDAKADQEIIAAMIKGKDVVLTTTPAKGSEITDTVSLTGFSQALAAIDRACGVKR